MKLSLLWPLVFMCNSLLAASYLGNKTSYIPQQDPLTYEKPSLQCKPVFISMLTRHGSRAINYSSHFAFSLQYFQKANTNSMLTAKGKIVHQWLRKMAAYEKYGRLTDQGAQELYNLGSRMQALYPMIFHNKSVQLESTYMDRAKRSRDSFQQGLSKGEHNTRFTSIDHTRCEDLELRYFSNCKLYQDYRQGEARDRKQSINSAALNEAKNTRAMDTIVQMLFQKKALRTLKQEDKHSLISEFYTLCQHDYNVDSKRGESKFCSLLPQDFRHVLKHIKGDVGSFYKLGPVQTYEDARYKNINYTMSCMPLRSMMNDIESVAQNTSNSTAHLRFAHLETVLPLAVLIGLFKTDKDIESSPTPQWDSSEIATMGANIQWIAYSCNEEQSESIKVKMLYNEKEYHFPIPECQNSFYCDWNIVKIFYEKKFKELGLGTCSISDWNRICGLHNEEDGRNFCLADKSKSHF